MDISKMYGKLAEILREDMKVRRVVKYLSPQHTLKATRRGRDSDTLEVIFTEGRPNYAEREFIRLCLEAGEPFPVRRIQYQYFPE